MYVYIWIFPDLPLWSFTMVTNQWRLLTLGLLPVPLFKVNNKIRNDLTSFSNDTRIQ